ncbi:D-alanyl-D-alanine carboxypeptidase [Winogradskyella sp. PC-19]|uniref:serine hydrolase domain-containing protein n=1 Tax=unclassified Winogradskyella TaxID=2615021 RepID=UPI000B3C8989|nr:MULTISPECIES: serine hydrolase domain-containing protein [unclassified Winogradskyella]ARV08814.1 D-alanyl-D-alanine carboxypeptidase [Winogradskyella sp. PC-19]RZN75983.1 MAG: class A beta-lactamase-related serine hydrolase [Winogradskyella sp.]
MKKILFLFVLLCNAVNLNAQDTKQIDDYLNVLEANNKLMATISVTKDGNQFYNKAVGFADVSSNVKNTNETKFRIGSITKAFTAVMIFQLIDEKRLTLDTPLSLYFNEIPNASKITIANLLNHSSGLFNITNASDFGEWMLGSSSRADMLKRLKSYDVDFNPGDKTAYSNTNYILLGYIIESIDKDIYAQALERRITSKIDLKDTYFGGKIDSENNESHSYAIENIKWSKQLETDMSNPGGAGAIVSTSSDLTKFMDALFTGKLMSDSSFEAMKKTNDGETCHGIFYANLDGLDIYASEGGIDGFQSMLIHVPKTKVTIALTANALSFSKMQIMLSVLGVTNGQSIIMPVFTELQLTEEQVKIYEGEYASSEVPYKLIFKANGTVLMGAPEQSNLQELRATKQHQFIYDNLSIVLDFYPGIEVVKFTKGNDKPILFKKIK